MRKLGFFTLILLISIIFVNCAIPIDWFNDENEDIIIKTLITYRLLPIFDAVAGNNNNLIRYLHDPIAGLEKSIFSYGINSSL